MRDLNQELENVNIQTKVLQQRRAYGFAKKIESQRFPLIKCADCGDLIPHNHNLLLKHYTESPYHNAANHAAKNQEKSFRFFPVLARKNPLGSVLR